MCSVACGGIKDLSTASDTGLLQFSLYVLLNGYCVQLATTGSCSVTVYSYCAYLLNGYCLYL